MSIADILADRDISEILHFTTNRGIVGVLEKKELLSRYRLPKEKSLEHILYVNAAYRPEASDLFDNSARWLDFVNLSISEINARYFGVSKKWHQGADIWWGILSFDPVIATHPGVYFGTTNNAYDQCHREQHAAGLDALFGARIQRKGPDWSVARGRREASLPTCEQAEVLYPEAVPIEFLRKIYVREGDHHDIVRGWLSEFGFDAVEVVLSPQKFLGKPN